MYSNFATYREIEFILSIWLPCVVLLLVQTDKTLKSFFLSHSIRY
jgi:hypothetical protein